ncbi:MAG: choloylglycine hydrolase family protein [Clostridia bacterium]|nr:choloylglycine hydrolase family protein [Clostridia bacterium]
MCTALSMNGKRHYFGRNLDLEYDFGQEVVVTPRKYPFAFSNGQHVSDHYAFVGMASVIDGYPMYADAVNEHGLGMAGLHFALSGAYPSAAPQAAVDVAPFEFVSWILSQCASLAEALERLSTLRLTDIPFSSSVPNSVLHWMLADSTGSAVVEPLPDGLVVKRDPYNVLTNDPPFSYHATNLNFYLNLTPEPPVNRFCAADDLQAMGKGTGAFGLPGDCSSASRFIRIAFNSGNSVCGAEDQAEMTQFFHLLDSVASVRGDVRTEEGKYFYTRYSSCMAGSCYYYKTYKNNQITAIDMNKTDLGSEALSIYPLVDTQQVHAGN